MMVAMSMREAVRSGPLVLVAALALAAACDSDDGHPDTGAGANEPVPPTENCPDLCDRLAACVVVLCDEDSASTKYSAIEPGIRASCMASCNEAQVQSTFTSTTWSCLFQSSCRAVFGNDTCHAMSHYNCS
jgi:hypothetical protein